MARRAVAVEHLPACLAEPSSSLERQLGWAVLLGQVGYQVSAR